MSDMERLRADERTRIFRSIIAPDDDCTHNLVPLFAAVESIIADRLAAAEGALARVDRDAVERSLAPLEALLAEWTQSAKVTGLGVEHVAVAHAAMRLRDSLRDARAALAPEPTDSNQTGKNQ